MPQPEMSGVGSARDGTLMFQNCRDAKAARMQSEHSFDITLPCMKLVKKCQDNPLYNQLMCKERLTLLVKE